MNFAATISQFEGDVDAALDFVTQEITREITDSIIERSPVDTGRFRGNWQLETGFEPVGETEALNKSSDEAKARIAPKINVIKAGNIEYIANNVPYAWRLEFEGWSQQAPNGMVRLTMVQIQSLTNNVAAKAKERVR